MEIKRTYYYNCSDKELKVSLKDFKDGPLPLVWFNQGMYGVIPASIIEDFISAAKDRAKLPQLDRKKCDALYWDQCTVIKPKIAKLLFGE